MKLFNSYTCAWTHSNHILTHTLSLSLFLEIVVGYEKIVYITPEGMSYVELCAVVTSHDGAPRPFIISATTQDGTAGI